MVSPTEPPAGGVASSSDALYPLCALALMTIGMPLVFCLCIELIARLGSIFPQPEPRKHARVRGFHTD